MNKALLNDCFRRGKHLATVEKDYDYAHTLFAECLNQEPENLAYAEALVANLKAKFDGKKKKAWHVLGLQGGREFKKALTNQNWPEVLRQGVDILRTDPWRVPTLRGMAQACQSLHHNDVQLVYLKQALEAAPKDVAVNRHCAKSLARMGQFDQAIACWHRVEEIACGSPEAARMISQLAQDKIHFAGRHANDVGSLKGKVTADMTTQKDKPEHAPSTERQQTIPDAVRISPRQRLERAIKEDPADVSNYLELSELLSEIGDFERAEIALNQALRECAQVTLVHEALQKVRALHRQAVQDATEIEGDKAILATSGQIRIPWLEMVLLAAGVVLLFQIFPSWWQAVSAALIAHAQILLVVVNVVVLLVLISWRQWKR